MPRKLRYISWREFDELCYKLADKLKGKKIKRITAIARGGLKVAERLAYILKIHDVYVIGLKSYKRMNQPGVLSRYTDLPVKLKDTLIVDDIFAAGRTFKYIESHIEIRENCIFATLFKQDNYVKHNRWLFVEETKDWIVWPTEVDLDGKPLEE